LLLKELVIAWRNWKPKVGGCMHACRQHEALLLTPCEPIKEELLTAKIIAARKLQ
jgi:hypothetical protein